MLPGNLQAEFDKEWKFDEARNIVTSGSQIENAAEMGNEGSDSNQDDNDNDDGSGIALDRRLSSQYFRESGSSNEHIFNFNDDNDDDMMDISDREASFSSDEDSQGDLRTYTLVGSAPTLCDLEESDFSVPANRYAYFSNLADVPVNRKSRLIGGASFIANPVVVQPFSATHGQGLDALIRRSTPSGSFVYTLAARPPSLKELETFDMQQKDGQFATPTPIKRQRRREVESQVEGPSGASAPKWPSMRPPPGSQAAAIAAARQCDNLTMLVVEVFCDTGMSTLLPNPTRDAVSMIAFALHDQSIELRRRQDYQVMSGVLYVGPRDCQKRSPLDVMYESEAELFFGFVELMTRFDPDIVAGFEMEKQSLGYLLDRAHALGLTDFIAKLSRVPTSPHRFDNRFNDIPNDEEEEADEGDEDDGRREKPRFGQKAKKERGRAVVAEAGEEPRMDRGGQIMISGQQIRDVSLVGRIMLNVWRVLRNDISLQHYSFESWVFHVLHRRVPLFTHRTLSEWWGDTRSRWRVMQHHVDRCTTVLELLDSMKTLERTSTLSKVIGIDFYSVLSRGSQYRVESMLLRLTRINNYVLLSPSRLQVNKQHAPMCVPMIMEPMSNFYHDPVLVMDFQSLYPSMVLAYNLCFSTCLGTMVNGKLAESGIGCSKTYCCESMDSIGSENIMIAPTSSSNGTLFARPSVRQGILPAMMTELLETRKMIKRRMKLSDDDPQLKQLLNFSQLALKLIANVSYGYTSASFTGRMPCIDVADSIVALGRRTIENCVATVEREWPNCKVVYGDTDSVFVLCRGSTHAEAFDIGEAIAKRVTALNPKPVKLNFEKVYHPCVLMSKKSRELIYESSL